MLEQLKTWDRELLIWLNALGIEQFDGFWIFVTKIESWIPLYLLFFFLFIRYHGWKKGLFLTGAVILTFFITLLLTDITKSFIGRLRPSNAAHLSGLIRVLQEPHGFSFFSGHASSSFAITTFIFLSLRNYSKWIILAYLWPLIFMLSRIYVGVHYPSDIVVGAMVGIIIGIVLHRISIRAVRRIWSE